MTALERWREEAARLGREWDSYRASRDVDGYKAACDRVNELAVQAKLELCVGCRDDFYNGKNPIGVQRCWSFDRALPVQRWRIGWWALPDAPGSFQKVWTNSCHSAPGRYADYDQDQMRRDHPKVLEGDPRADLPECEADCRRILFGDLDEACSCGAAAARR